MTTPDLLEAIVAATRQEVAVREQKINSADLKRISEGVLPKGEDFAASLKSIDRINIIAECKKCSPSRGVLREVFKPGSIAMEYASSGAAAISVLTESAFFDGKLEDLVEVRSAVEVPLLRNDFLVTEYQILEARAAGADAVLLIVSALDNLELKNFIEYAHGIGLAVMVEVHNSVELEQAISAGAKIIGVNNRNLRTLEVDLEASHRLIEQIPENLIAVAESGLKTSEDLVALRAEGYDAFLIGESLMTSTSPGNALLALLNGVGAVTRGERMNTFLSTQEGSNGKS
jgi:indole-3-glycerol phosphate synthase